MYINLIEDFPPAFIITYALSPSCFLVNVFILALRMWYCSGVCTLALHP